MSSSSRNAILYRMVTDEHVCPFGLKSLDLLKRQGFSVDDRPLTTRAETDAFMAEHDVETTPQTFIGGRRIGGYDELLQHFGKADEEGADGVGYGPVIAVFAMSALMALAAAWAAFGTILTPRSGEWFVAIAMCMLAMLKLRDIEGFSNMFLGYDLLAQRWVRYAYLYPFGEALAGILMLAGAALWLAVPVAFVIGSIGAVSVFKAVYLDRRELTCACVGGDSKVPLGFVSLTENLMMVAMAIWMVTGRQMAG